MIWPNVSIEEINCGSAASATALALATYRGVLSGDRQAKQVGDLLFVPRDGETERRLDFSGVARDSAFRAAPTRLPFRGGTGSRAVKAGAFRARHSGRPLRLPPCDRHDGRGGR